MLLPKDIIEVFRTEKGCVFQSDSQNCFYVEFAGNTSFYKTKCFLKLMGLVNTINLQQKLTCTQKSSDCEIISMGACEKFYVFTTLCELVAFKELLIGAKVMLELNGIIRERLFCLPA